MKNRLTNAELRSYKFLKEKAKESRLKICRDRDIEYSKLPFGMPVKEDYKVDHHDMKRPLTDFMNTDDAMKYLYIRNKLNIKVIYDENE